MEFRCDNSNLASMVQAQVLPTTINVIFFDMDKCLEFGVGEFGEGGGNGSEVIVHRIVHRD
jgi:hypothetical protein